MKTIATFAGGAVLAALLMYFVMSHDTKTPAPAAATPAAEQTPTAAVQPPAPVPAPLAPVAEPESKPASSHKPSAVPQRASAHKPASTAPSGNSSTAPITSSTTTTAQNTPPASSPTGGPIIPYDPVRASVPAPPPEDKKPEPPKREPKTVTIPAGTLLTVRVDEALSTAKNHAGDSFRASLDQPLVVDGFVIAERGARVEGRVAESDPGGRVRGVSQLSLELVRLNTSDGQRVKLTTQSFAKQGEKNVGKDAAKVGAAAGIGAAIGAIAGGGKGAGIGAIIGGAAGTGGVMATRGAAAQLPAETRVSFRLREPITITERLP